jgi:hypothetical protein
MKLKKNSVIVPLLAFVLVLSPFAVICVEAFNPQPEPPRGYILSLWASSPPTIDGQFSSSDLWRNPQLELMPPDFPIHAFVYIANDGRNLYIMVDAANAFDGDYSEEAEDHCMIAFHNPMDGMVFSRRIYGRDGGIVEPDFEAMVGFGASPNSPIPHRMYEFMVSHAVITITLTGANWVHFASPETISDSLPFDYNGGESRYNIYPLNVVPNDYDTWGAIVLASPPPVGGEMLPVSGLASTTPWIALGLVALVMGSTALWKKRRCPV